MPLSMPISLVLSMSILLLCAYSQNQTANNFQGASVSYLKLLTISALLAFCSLIILLLYYFFQVAWYWPFILFMAIGAIGGALNGIVTIVVKDYILSFIAFIGWPAAAIWSAITISNINP